jgi:hypothetical protein
MAAYFPTLACLVRLAKKLIIQGYISLRFADCFVA